MFVVEYNLELDQWEVFHKAKNAGYPFKSFDTEQLANEEAEALNLWWNSKKV